MAGSIQGQIVDQRTGQGLAGATLSLQPQGGDQTSGGKGDFEFADLPAGNDYELTATAPGFQDGLYGPLVVIDDVTTPLKIGLQPAAS